MSNLSILGVIATILVAGGTGFSFMADSIDKRIKAAINDPAFLEEVARKTQLPFLIFDEKGVYQVERNSSGLVDTVDIKMNESGKVEFVKVTPTENISHMLLEAMNFSMEFAVPRREGRYAWIWSPAKSESAPRSVRTGEVVRDEDRLVRQFKVTLIR